MGLLTKENGAGSAGSGAAPSVDMTKLLYWLLGAMLTLVMSGLGFFLTVAHRDMTDLRARQERQDGLSAERNERIRGLEVQVQELGRRLSEVERETLRHRD